MYVARAPGRTARQVTAACPALGAVAQPSSRAAAPIENAGPEVKRIQLPMLIGDVGLKTRSMFRKRSGPAEVGDEQRRADGHPDGRDGHARRASTSLSATSAATAKGAAPRPAPPTKRYQGISQVQVGSLRIGRP